MLGISRICPWVEKTANFGFQRLLQIIQFVFRAILIPNYLGLLATGFR
jgi:hypothetical protein